MLEAIAGVAATVESAVALEGVNIAAEGASVSIADAVKVAKEIELVMDALESGDVDRVVNRALGAVLAHPAEMLDMASGALTALAERLQPGNPGLEPAVVAKDLGAVLFEGPLSLPDVFHETGRGTYLLGSLDQIGPFKDALTAYGEAHDMRVLIDNVQSVVGAPLDDSLTVLAGPLADLEAMWKVATNEYELNDVLRAGAGVMTIVAISTANPGLLTMAESLRKAADVTRAAERTIAGLAPGSSGKALGVAKEGLSAEQRAMAEFVEGAGMEFPQGRVTPEDFKARFDHLEANLPVYFEYVYRTNEPFRDLCDRYVERLKAAQELGPGEVLRVELDMKRNLTGEFARVYATDALGVYFESAEFEVRVPVGDRYTKIDILFHGAKVPIVGQGGIHVPKGGSFSTECKAGRAPFLASEEGHLAFQAEGSRVADSGLTVVTKDFSQVEVTVQQRIRDTLRPNAPLYKLLPEKERLERVVLHGIRDRANGVKA